MTREAARLAIIKTCIKVMIESQDRTTWNKAYQLMLQVLPKERH